MKDFEKIDGEEFYVFPSIIPYKLEILKKYKDKVYNTLFLPNGPASLGMHTIIQIDSKHHIVFVWGNSIDNKESTVYATIHTSKASNFLDFLKNNEVFVYNDDQRGGFSP
jgi:hypothetical protein